MELRTFFSLHAKQFTLRKKSVVLLKVDTKEKNGKTRSTAEERNPGC